MGGADTGPVFNWICQPTPVPKNHTGMAFARYFESKLHPPVLQRRLQRAFQYDAMEAKSEMVVD